MAMFWEHGFCNLSTRKLEQETGITRFTLQTTYGGKMALYLNTLDAYLDQFETSGLLQGVDDSLHGIAAFFERRANASVLPESSKHGCLVLNAVIEFASIDKDVNLRVTRYLTLLRRNFRSGLANSLGDQGAAERKNIDEKTEILLAAALGLNVVIRAASDSNAGQAMAVSIAHMVRDWS